MTMHENDIDLLCEEANRLLGVSLSLLDILQEESSILIDSTDGKSHTLDQYSFDKRSVGKAIEVFQGEQLKLDRLEMVLAVVGTMKAGKSTTINAIVGTEILPNRNRPMTAIPTLIRHTPGQYEPVLHFENSEPANNLIHKLRTIVADQSNTEKLDAFEHNDDMKTLLSQIENGQTLSDVYKGTDEIFEFLCYLNDLVRLSAALGVEFPFDSYDEIHEIPVINIEFSSLKNISLAKGHLTLLDTPGPNEAGQEHLQVMLTEQLSKASAVLAVLDYTQLKSIADEDVRHQLEATAKVAQGSVYALVNKFDQKDRHGDSREQTRKYIAHDLMRGILEEGHVFPASSRWGYLSSRALSELSRHQQLPKSDKQPWVVDFAHEALGRRWENKISNPVEVKEAATELWQDSYFSEPLEKIIHSAHARAAILAVKSSSDKLVDYTGRLDQFLGMRESVLTHDTKELQRQIEQLVNDIKNISHYEQETLITIEQMLRDLTNAARQQFIDNQHDLTETLVEYFQNGTLEQFDSHIVDFPFDSTTIRFDSLDDANDLLFLIEDRVNQVMDISNTDIYNTLMAVVDHFETKTTNRILKTRDLIDDIQHRTSGDVFSIGWQMPKLNLDEITLSTANMFDGLIINLEESKVGRRRQLGIWGKICGWLGIRTWGWESYTSTARYYEISLPKVQRSVLTGVKLTFNKLDEAITRSIENPVNTSVTDFFCTLKTSIEEIRDDLIRRCRDKRRDQIIYTNLIKRVTSLKGHIPVEESQVLKKSISSLLLVEAHSLAPVETSAAGSRAESLVRKALAEKAVAKESIEE